MKGLITKEFFTLKQQVKTISVMVLMYLVLAYMQEDAVGLFSGMIVMVIAMLPVTSIAYDEQAKWDRYALTLPISRKQLVLSKYVLTVILIFISLLLSVVFTILIELIKGHSIDILEVLMVSGVCGTVGLLFVSILLPITFKLGSEKARGSMMLIFIVPTLLIVLLGKLGIRISEAMLINVAYALPVILIVAVIISINVSIKIVKNKEY